ncbi:LysR substrate-binding domain-containing protein [Streptomyces bluensis]|uniref:LysR substrate-binding domain-containing protein n=1 Tax=Streptomyces bluensis TaxID=33897 RepID=A0ABW6UKE4_9ACTN
MAGRDFDPSAATGIVRVVCTDYAASTLGTHLLPRLLRAAPKLEVRFEPRGDDSYTDLEQDRADIVLSVLRPAAPLRWERLFTDDVICVVDHDHPVRDRFSLAEYVAARHLVITLIQQEQPLIERWLQALGHSRTAAVRAAHFSSAFAVLPGTPLVATIPRRLAEQRAATNPRMRLVEARKSSTRFPTGWSGTHVWTPIRCTPGYATCFARRRRT